MTHSKQNLIAIIGLLLAMEFGKQRKAIDFDINAVCIVEPVACHDHTYETTPEEPPKQALPL